MSGLSGGSWAVGGFAAQDMKPTWEWMETARLDENIFYPGFLDSFSYFYDMFEDIEDKKHAGFEVAISDYWARALRSVW